MKAISCPVCQKRICDSDKSPRIAKVSKSNLPKADIVIKCHNCKNQLAIKIPKKVIGKNADLPPDEW